jgi:hypothetical protein
MNTGSKQKELLLMLNSSFFSKTWVEKNHAEDDSWFSQKDQLKEACWNGESPKLLPECFDQTSDESAKLWNINDANMFIDLVFCKYTQKKEKQFSLNPYVFMQVQELN